MSDDNKPISEGRRRVEELQKAAPVRNPALDRLENQLRVLTAQNERRKTQLRNLRGQLAALPSSDALEAVIKEIDEAIAE